MTDAPLGAAAVGTARDGGYEETLTSFNAPDADLLIGAYERHGTYTVTVSHAGYSTWTQNNVVVTSGECHVNSVELNVHLTPQ